MSCPDIARLDAKTFAKAIGELADLLADAVGSGASVGFVLPFDASEAAAWWRGQAADVTARRLVVLAASIDGRLVGTVQLRLAQLPNARHRAEVAKLLVHRSVRRRGVGRALMTAIENEAREASRTLLVLDTETGSEAERLYLSLGWTFVAAIPRWGENPSGGLRPTSIYYKEVV
ncbi:MAG TPA: GNAT family N-acetyltransferase [Candidatus Limnocylindria bacterium]|jgi:GNAT superfamily N-acetyltransferase|nr:GNAT family N-acetyltransferase [Candidatus Limnocylindria bacterium]